MKKKRDLGMQDKLGDMTSMIDVVFLLLIFFILMPFKSTESKIESYLPKDSGMGKGKSTEEKVEKIDIRIKVINLSRKSFNLKALSGVTVSVNGKVQATFLGLKGRLAEMSNSIGGNLEKIPVEINADENVPFYFVLKAVDYAKLSKFSFIKFPASPELEWGKKPKLTD